MSILNKLKNLNTRKAARLLEVHPLAGESLELRLQYLAGVALATAIDREPSDAERMAFNALADSLQVDAVDAQEQLDERASVTEEDIALLFAAIRERDAGCLYLLDLAWIHAADGELEENEIAVTEQLAGLLELDQQAVANLHYFALALRERSLLGNLQLIASVWRHGSLNELLIPLINRTLPFAGVIEQHWIDHGNGTATDTRSGLTWHRKSVGKVSRFSESWFNWGGESAVYVETALQEFNSLFPEDYRDWRAPYLEELEKISICKKLPAAIFTSLGNLETQKFYYSTQKQQQQQQQQQQQDPFLELICCRELKGNQ